MTPAVAPGFALTNAKSHVADTGEDGLHGLGLDPLPADGFGFDNKLLVMLQ
jgi:hypothetical protein